MTQNYKKLKQARVNSIYIKAIKFMALNFLKCHLFQQI